LAHFAVLVAHGSAHSQLHIGVGTWQKAFIAIVIFMVPLIATVMLWTRVRKLGVILLGVSLAGSLVFGVSYHFVIAGPDNALGPYHSDWESAFRATAALLALIEAQDWLGAFGFCISNHPARNKEHHSMPSVITNTSDNAPRPIGPYSHIARVGNFLTIGGKPELIRALESLSERTSR